MGAPLCILDERQSSNIEIGHTNLGITSVRNGR